MRWVGRRHLLGLACLAAAGLVGLAAIADHHWKQARQDRAEVAAWYCAHQRTHCGEESASKIETRWNEREVGYKIVVSVLGATGVGLLLLGSFGRRSNRALRQPPV
jgi:hypothetical protein